MSKKSVLGKPDYRASLPRHGHNMTQPLHFTSSCGHILPVYYDYLSYGDKIRISADLFTRTEPLLKPVMGDVDEYVDFFFVPMRRIFQPFDELERGVDDFASMLFASDGNFDATGIDGFKVLPTIDWSWMFNNPALQGQYQARYSYNGGELLATGLYRLLDLLGANPNQAYNTHSTFRTMNGEDQGEAGARPWAENYLPNFVVAPLAAYQCIYYDYYRLSEWENNKTWAYNFDDVVANSMKVPFGSMNRLADLFRIHYRAYNRDYFKALSPSPLLNSIGILSSSFSSDSRSASVSSRDLRSWLIGSDSIVLDHDGGGSPFGSDATDIQFETGTLATFRQTVAYQKMLKITNRAGRHFDDQVLAHFGFKVPQGISNEVYFLGSHHQQVHFGEVISTAATEDAALGSLAGKGYAKGVSETITFTAPCIGVVMACYSCVPRISYTAGVDKLLSMNTRFDFPQPELDKLGQQPLFNYEVSAAHSNIASTRFGWQWRYMHLKTKYPKSTRAFRAYSGSRTSTDGSYRDWVFNLPANRYGDLMVSGNVLETMLCLPTDMNSVFSKIFQIDSFNSVIQDIDESGIAPYNVVYRGDNFIHDLTIKCYKTSWMSTFGEEDI